MPQSPKRHGKPSLDSGIVANRFSMVQSAFWQMPILKFTEIPSAKEGATRDQLHVTWLSAAHIGPRSLKPRQ